MPTEKNVFNSIQSETYKNVHIFILFKIGTTISGFLRGIPVHISKFMLAIFVYLHYRLTLSSCNKTPVVGSNHLFDNTGF